MPLSPLVPRGEREKISGGCVKPTSKSGTRDLLNIRRSMFNVQCSMFALSAMNDLRYAFRQLLKHPGFTAVAVLTLALCIGANLALFTMLDDQFLCPRPVLRPNELWSIVPADASGEPRFFNFSRPYYDAIRQSNRVFKDLISITG